MSDLTERLRRFDDAGLTEAADLLMAEAADEIDRLTQGRDEAKADAARLQWISDNAKRLLSNEASACWSADEALRIISASDACRVEDLRAAIDAERGE